MGGTGVGVGSSHRSCGVPGGCTRSALALRCPIGNAPSPATSGRSCAEPSGAGSGAVRPAVMAPSPKPMANVARTNTTEESTFIRASGLANSTARPDHHAVRVMVKGLGGLALESQRAIAASSGQAVGISGGDLRRLWGCLTGVARNDRGDEEHQRLGAAIGQHRPFGGAAEGLRPAPRADGE
jgi:hypothetical protein